MSGERKKGPLTAKVRHSVHGLAFLVAVLPGEHAGEDGQGGEGGDAPKDDVIDADFQEVDEGDKKKRA